jgi:hypothetical protein
MEWIAGLLVAYIRARRRTCWTTALTDTHYIITNTLQHLYANKIDKLSHEDERF